MKIFWICFLCLISFSAVSEERRYDVSTQKYTYYSGELGIFDLEMSLKNIRFVWRKEVLQVLESLIL